MAPLLPQPSPPSSLHQPKMRCVKILAETPGLTSIPPNYAFTTTPHEHPVSDPEESIPVIDFSLLTSGTPDQRSKIIQDLGKACQEWGFFRVINHGVPESLMKLIMDAFRGFFDLTEEEKREFEGTHVLDSIRCGTSSNVSVDKVFYWRDFVKFFVHPEFFCPNKPTGFSEIALEYSKRTRDVARELLKAISESLGVEECHMRKALNQDSGLQMLISNLYPPCPQPELAMGMPPHSDNGLLTLLIQNEIDALQLQHNGKWVNVNAIPNTFLVNIGDHLEIWSNGKYKSVVHRALVNNKATRMSVAVISAPSMDTIVRPEMELVDSESNPPAYIPMKFREYLQFQQSTNIDGKSCLDRLRI